MAIKRMRWKAIHFSCNENNDSKMEWYGLKFSNNKVLKRMQANGENNCFISLKTHKENLQNNPTVRLMKPARSELGKISKVILDKINKNTRKNLQLNQ